jgi:hypothetical protein
VSSKDGSRRCSATTKAGQPYRAWAMEGSSVCAAHAGKTGAPKGNRNRLTHGWYAAPSKPVVTIEDAIENLGERLAHSTEFLDQVDDPALWFKAFNLHAQGLSRLGRLLRDKRALSGKSAETLLDVIGQVIDEISTELGVEL